MEGENSTTYQAEVLAEKNELRKTYGWYLLAKEVSEYTKLTYFEVMDRAAIEVLGVVSIMQAQAEINKTN